MNTVPDDKLVRQATHAGRNLFVLAAIASLLFVVFAALVATKEARLAGALMAPAVGLIAAGYWVLAVAAKRGNPSAVKVVVVALLLQLIPELFLIGLGQRQAGWFPGRVLILILILLVLNKNRNVLLELQKRGLWDSIFGWAPPSGRICWVGGGLLVAGLIALISSGFYMGVVAGRAKQANRRQAAEFVAMIKGEEQAFLKARAVLAGAYGPEDLALAVTKLQELEAKARSLRDANVANAPLHEILESYHRAVGLWQEALAILPTETADVEKANKKLTLGDQSRRLACEAFDRKYTKKP